MDNSSFCYAPFFVGNCLLVSDSLVEELFNEVLFQVSLFHFAPDLNALDHPDWTAMYPATEMNQS